MRAAEVYRRVMRRMEKLGLTEYSAAIRAGLSKDAIRNLRRTIEGADVNRRGDVATKTVEALAPALKTTPWWLMWGIGAEEAGGDGESISMLPVLGKIQAGLWLDTSVFDPDAEQRSVAAMRDPRYPHARHYCLEVAGDSVDQVYPEGTIVVCIDFAESGLALKTGQMAHVERRRAGGQMIEITLKEVRLDKGHIILVPRSSNPAYKPLKLNESEEESDEVIVRGIVVSGITPAPVV